MPNPTVFLHIGINKTGTSVIQRYFSSNRDKLKKEGILYPNSGCDNFAHYTLSRLLGFGLQKNEEVEVLEDRLKSLNFLLKNEIEENESKVVILSSEYFSLPRKISRVREFFKDYTVKIVVYFRRHDSWFPFSYNQAVKTTLNPPWKFGFEKFLEFKNKHQPYYGDYKLLLERWAKHFGKENIIVRPYESQQNKPNIVADFFYAVGQTDIANDVMLLGMPRINQSLDYFSLVLIDMFQRSALDDDCRKQLIAHAVSQSKRQSQDEWISPALRYDLIKKNLASYEFIAKEYLDRENGILFYDELPNPNEDFFLPHKLNYPELIDFMSSFSRTVKLHKWKWV